MTLTEPVLLAILDKAVIGVLILFATYWLDTRLERIKARVQQAALSTFRVQALGALWNYTQPVPPVAGISLKSRIAWPHSRTSAPGTTRRLARCIYPMMQPIVA